MGNLITFHKAYGVQLKFAINTFKMKQEYCKCMTSNVKLIFYLTKEDIQMSKAYEKMEHVICH